MKAILMIILSLLVSCGKADKMGCQTREQIMALCIAEGIQLRPNPMQLNSVKIDCTRQYPVEACYGKGDGHFPYSY